MTSKDLAWIELATAVGKSGVGWRCKSGGRSMFPAIRSKDSLVIEGLPGTVRRGNIIVFSSQGRLVAHRVIRVSGQPPEMCITKGDFLFGADDAVEMCRIIGRVVAIERGEQTLHLPFYSPGATLRASLSYVLTPVFRLVFFIHRIYGKFIQRGI